MRSLIRAGGFKRGEGHWGNLKNLRFEVMSKFMLVVVVVVGGFKVHMYYIMIWG
jgi:hypothetical protein